MTTPSTHDDACNCGKGTDRRTFLQASALAASGLAFASPLARAATAPPVASKKTTVVLFQRGGADALSLFAPTGDANYAVQRPTMGISPPGGLGSVVGLYMNPLFSMHPSLAGIYARYTATGSHVGIVHAVGHQPYDRSHFTSQDELETGSPDGSLDTGWINRHLMATSTARDAPVRGLALIGSMPKSLAGPYPCYAVSSTSALVFQGRLPDVRPCLETITETTPTVLMSAPRQLAYQSGASTFDLIDLFSVLHPTTYVPANGAVYPNTALGTAMKQAAEMIKARLGVEFICVDQGGWDHHSALLTRISTYAQDYDQSINAFFTDLGLAADNVVLVSMSEFGREVHENGSAGADHGVGGAMVLIGGQVRGGQVIGNWPGLATAQLQDGRFLAPRNDFRNVLLELLDRHMGGTAMDAVFPGHSYSPLGIF
jgi:uncharacterized protein (DUF1501 family)